VAQTFALEVQPCHKLRLQDKLTELKRFDHDSGKTKLELLHQVKLTHFDDRVINYVIIFVLLYVANMFV
jgi:hypothetical protein